MLVDVSVSSGLVSVSDSDSKSDSDDESDMESSSLSASLNGTFRVHPDDIEKTVSITATIFNQDKFFNH